MTIGGQKKIASDATYMLQSSPPKILCWQHAPKKIQNKCWRHSMGHKKPYGFSRHSFNKLLRKFRNVAVATALDSHKRVKVYPKIQGLKKKKAPILHGFATLDDKSSYIHTIIYIHTFA